jgi:hypothetical protein
MPLPSAYLMTTKNLESFFNSLITAQAPPAFTQRFLESLEFKSTNDRLYIGLLKSLGFIDANAVPTQRYFSFLDQSESKQVLAKAVKEAYADLFAINTKAYELTTSEVKNKLRTLTQGKNSEKVLGLMANTFTALVNYAEWKSEDKKTDDAKGSLKAVAEEPIPSTRDAASVSETESESSSASKLPAAQLHYNIQIHLPESRDPAVYDALFRSLKRHLF